jgi:hypothetical protein
MKEKGKAHSKRFAQPSDDRDSWKTMTKPFQSYLIYFSILPFNCTVSSADASNSLVGRKFFFAERGWCIEIVVCPTLAPPDLCAPSVISGCRCPLLVNMMEAADTVQ